MAIQKAAEPLSAGSCTVGQVVR